MNGGLRGVDTADPREVDVVTLREIEWTDLPRLAELETELFGQDAWSEASWWAELAGRPRREYVVAVTDDGDIVGYAGVDHGREVADVMTIAVAERGRRRGLGSRLLHALLEMARRRGEAHVMLEVRADNAAAIALYERFGFDTLSVRRRYYQPGDVDAHVMRLTLEGHRP